MTLVFIVFRKNKTSKIRKNQTFFLLAFHYYNRMLHYDSDRGISHNYDSNRRIPVFTFFKLVQIFEK